MSTIRKRRLSGGACLLAAALSPVWTTDAQANQWTSDFIITNLYVAGQNNFQYRVYGMSSLQSLCPNSPNWAYVNESDSGAKGRVATILAAFYAGRAIRVYVTVTGGYCQIEELFAS